MKKVFLLGLLMSIVFFVGVASATARSDFGLVTVQGKVQAQEIGGNGLYVFSVWNGNKRSFVDAQGSFSVQILSNSRPQKISLRDNTDKTRALALVFSESASAVVFDARSTALAVVLGDPDLVKDLTDMQRFLHKVDRKPSFEEFVSFLKKNLPSKNLELLSKDPAYVDLFEACNREIFGEDRSAIKRSLRDAQGKLEKILQ